MSKQKPINRSLDIQYLGAFLHSPGYVPGNGLIVKDRMGGITIFFDWVETAFDSNTES